MRHGLRDRLFVWERPLRKSDLEALGAEAPAGPILVEAWLARAPTRLAKEYAEKHLS